MHIDHRSWILALPTLCGAALFSVAACSPAPSTQHPDGSPSGDPTVTAPPTADPTATATNTPTIPVADPSGTAFGCRLPEPKRSGDKCNTDADCGVSEPCHAKACVAKAKAHPPDKDTICTRMMDCSSADANACACFEGVCALVPPAK